jgi:hypothetical protein
MADSFAFAYAIYDRSSKTYFQRKIGPTGWYGDLINVRLYNTRSGAWRTINDAHHHVTYPGTRDLLVVDVQITDLINDPQT